MEHNPIEVQKHLKGIKYPASREDLVETARENDAPEDLLEDLESLDEQEFSGPDDVQEALKNS